MLTLEKYNNPEYISNIYLKVEKFLGINEREIESLDAVLTCKRE